jgi:hypothetical protein
MMTDQDKYIHEVYATALERANKRLWILCVILIILFVGTNAGWLYYESQFEDVTTTTTIDAQQDGSGNNTVVGGDYEPTSEDNKNN